MTDLEGRARRVRQLFQALMDGLTQAEALLREHGAEAMDGLQLRELLRLAIGNLADHLATHMDPVHVAMIRGAAREIVAEDFAIVCPPGCGEPN